MIANQVISRIISHYNSSYVNVVIYRVSHGKVKKVIWLCSGDRFLYVGPNGYVEYCSTEIASSMRDLCKITLSITPTPSSLQ